MRITLGKNIVLTFLMPVLFGACALLAADKADKNAGQLSGTVRSVKGEPMAAIPVQASLQDKNITQVVYTNRDGKYAFRELPQGSHTVNIHVAGFEQVKKEAVKVAASKTKDVDFILQPSPPSIREMTSSEIALSLPGTGQQRATLVQCSNCHSLAFALQKRRDRQGWIQMIEKMRGITPSGVMQPVEAMPGILQRSKEENEQLAEFLAAVRGPDSPELPYKLLPRPTDNASTRLAITEYHIPRGNIPVTIRGDVRGAWLHDVIRDPKTGYVWYTDHFTSVLGRLDPKTGEIKEFPYPHAKPGKQDGALQVTLDRDGNVWLGLIWQGTIARFDPRTEKFTEWTIAEDAQAGFLALDSAGLVWFSSSRTNSIYKLETQTSQFAKFTIPTKNAQNYGMGLDSQGRVYSCEMGAGKIGRFDPKTEKFAEWPTPTPDSMPRRPAIDAQDRLWFAEFSGDRIGLFDPKTETIREWKLSDNPYTSPYIVAVDNKSHVVWATDFNSNLIYRFDIKTQKFTKFLLPEPDIEIRHLYMDESTTPGTLWIPDYSPPGKILRLQAW